MGGSSLLMASPSRSHATHFFSEKGPRLPHNESGCYVCHADGRLQCQSRPLFADMNFFEVTHVCDACHSPGGAFDGVAMAKTNWDSGIYEADGKSLRPGKEYWCASCHDILPANSKKDSSGIDAPKVIGDNSTYGFYVTGHGAHGLVACLSCPNTRPEHIDHEHRTYASASDNYQAGYRLAKGLVVPRPTRGDIYANLDDFALCIDCHNPYEVLGEDVYDESRTNFSADAAPLSNGHNLHIDGIRDSDSDWDGVLDSDPTCITCHNVHGPPNQAMVRHGELMSTYGTTDKVPGLNFSYMTSVWPNVYDTEVDLKDSVASNMAWVGASFAQNGFCNGPCHGTETMVRTPYLGPKVLTNEAYPNNVPADGTTEVLITALLADHNDNVPSDGVTIDLSNIDGGVETMYDDGSTGGDLTADDNIFSYTLTVPDTVAAGYKSLQITATDPDGVGKCSITLHVQTPGEVVLDNTEAAYVGTWTSFTNADLYEGEGQYHEVGSGANTATWTPDIPEAGYYNVYAWWNSNSSRATDAPYTINYDGGSETIDIDQSRYGGVWVLLGTYPFTAGISGSVVLSDDADDYYVIADAVKFELADPDVIIRDDINAAFVGTWPPFTNPVVYGGDAQYHEAGSGANTATWTPLIFEAGYYNVYARWAAHTNRASDAPFTIHYDGGSETIDIDQRRYNGVWVLLGTYPFAAGTSGSVVLSDDANGYLNADAIKWEREDPSVLIRDDINATYVGTWPSYESAEAYGGDAQYHEGGSGANTAIWTPTIRTAGNYKVYAWWFVGANRATDAPYTVNYDGGSETIDVDQLVNGGQWNLLGTYPFATGTSGSVVLSDDANGYIVSDAIKWELQP